MYANFKHTIKYYFKYRRDFNDNDNKKIIITENHFDGKRFFVLVHN